jgi:hypothetical protein
MPARRYHFIIGIIALILLPVRVNAAGLEGFAKIPYSVIDNRYVLRCTLNGKPLNMIIDCGAYATVIDTSVFDGAIPKSEQVVPKGLPAKIAANDIKVPVVLAKNLRIGSLLLADRPVTIYDFKHSNTYARHFARLSVNEHVVIDGLLGLDILRNYNAIIDTTHQVIFLDPSRSKGGGRLAENMQKYGFKRVPMTLDRHGNLEVPCALNGKAGRLIVDTGANFTQLDYRYVRSAGMTVRPSSSLNSGVGMQMKLGVGNGGASELLITETDQFKVGDYLFPKGAIGCLQHGFPTDGFFGPDLMERGHAFLDFGNLSMFLK